MYDLTAELQTFYDAHVRLGSDRRSKLAGFRDLNIQRLKAGLDVLAIETGRAKPHPYDWQNQGGYAMHTLNQDPNDDNDYDIDVGLIFNKDDLPDDPRTARQRMADALAQKCTNFTQEPTARTNAVTVWYAEGYHIDFAIYRTYLDATGIKRIEHASTEWKRRDPAEINNWFSKCVTEKSPKANVLAGSQPRVAPNQFRRIVRFLKWFSRSRPSWSLPGGMVMSALAEHAYVSNSDRDDRALYDTLVKLRSNLAGSTQVFNPVDGVELTGNAEVANQVKRLKAKLDDILPKLVILFDTQNCTRAKARSAWDWVFNHTFWADKERVVEAALDHAGLAYTATITCDLSRKIGGKAYKRYASGSSVLPKNVALRFALESTNVPRPFLIEWETKNEGDEAVAERELGRSTGASNADEHWTTTAYKGRHRMVCRIHKNGRVVAEAVHSVKVAPGRWWQGR